MPVDGRDEWARESIQRHEHAVEVAHPSLDLRRPRALQFLDVTAGGEEAGTCTGEDHRCRYGLGGQLGEERAQAGHEAVIQRVRGRSVHGDDQDAGMVGPGQSGERTGGDLGHALLTVSGDGAA